ncbi:diaminopimelate dehydrogenase [[Eubacterium] yurii subsp. margaretiae ATCC 43715]|nr:diaminopimelate dehydrogenase [[Eubacterium] yurii subsp. margaretiae ATCC 43715]
MKKIKIGIIGYGNLGRGVEEAVKHSEDMELVAVFTRRDKDSVKTGGAKVESLDKLANYKDEIDICVLCGGSATDILTQAPKIAETFNTVDSFDTHAKVPEYFATMDGIAKKSGKLSMISTGWDPGLFSIMRVLFESILPKGDNYTFWGKGISQGHSDAIRRIDGVLDAKQYTIPKEDVINSLKNGEKIEITATSSHIRECFVVVDEKADKSKIEQSIKTMPNYFEGYETIVHFISQEELDKNHNRLPHGGKAIRYGATSEQNNEVIEFSLNLDSNPEFTASVNIACVRALYKMIQDGKTGACTILDVPVGYFSPKSSEELRAHYL